jgi:hypothetical protein
MKSGPAINNSITSAEYPDKRRLETVRLIAGGCRVRKSGAQTEELRRAARPCQSVPSLATLNGTGSALRGAFVDDDIKHLGYYALHCITVFWLISIPISIYFVQQTASEYNRFRFHGTIGVVDFIRVYGISSFVLLYATAVTHSVILLLFFLVIVLVITPM